MKILYVTNAQSKNSYKNFLSLWKNGINTSNQVFHNKLIRSFSIDNEVSVFSIRPLNNNCSAKYHKEGYENDTNIHWYYPTIKQNKILRLLSIKKDFKKFVADNNFDFVVIDCINYVCLKLVEKYCKNIKKIGVCTDFISNISNIKNNYAKKVLSLSQNMDSYICLTDGLNKAINIYNKDALIIEGIVEDNINFYNKNKNENYFFYCGTLLEKYGINNLIKAYNLIANPKPNLYIAGHHYDNDFMNNLGNGIKFLGCLDNEETLWYEYNSLACINPRQGSDLDEYSVPSKTLEYLSTGSIVISGKNKILSPIFKDDILWIDTNNISEIKNTLTKVMQNNVFVPKHGRDKVTKLYSIKSVSNKLNEFLKKII